MGIYAYLTNHHVSPWITMNHHELLQIICELLTNHCESLKNHLWIVCKLLMNHPESFTNKCKSLKNHSQIWLFMNYLQIIANCLLIADK